MKREDTRVSILCLKVLNDLKFLSTQCLLQLTQHYCFIKRSLHCPYSYKFCFFQGQPNTESVKWLAFISLIKCNLIIRDYKELFFSLTLSQSSRKSTKSTEPCVLSPNHEHRAASFWPQQNPMDWAPEWKRLKRLFPSNIDSYFLLSQTRCQASVASLLSRVFGSSLELLRCFVRAKPPGADRTHYHVYTRKGLGEELLPSVLQECFGRWHVPAQSGCSTSSSRHILLTYL